MQTILFGTNNQDKLREIQEILSAHYAVKSLADIGLDLDVEETEDSLHGNALLKARAYHEASGLPCFADDTGLAVDALYGRPGVYSARYAGEACSYQDNVDKLLREMAGKSVRSARFMTVIAFVTAEEIHYFEGTAEGEILQAEQGKGGFGYDPVFRPLGFDQSFAEMPPETKNSISHRGKAVAAFSEFILQQNR